MIAEAASSGLHEEPSFARLPRLQIVIVEQAMALRERAVYLPARRGDTFKQAEREEDPGRQSALDLFTTRAASTFLPLGRRLGWGHRQGFRCPV